MKLRINKKIIQHLAVAHRIFSLFKANNTYFRFRSIFFRLYLWEHLLHLFSLEHFLNCCCTSLLGRVFPLFSIFFSNFMFLDWCLPFPLFVSLFFTLKQTKVMGIVMSHNHFFVLLFGVKNHPLFSFSFCFLAWYRHIVLRKKEMEGMPATFLEKSQRHVWHNKALLLILFTPISNVFNQVARSIS